MTVTWRMFSAGRTGRHLTTAAAVITLTGALGGALAIGVSPAGAAATPPPAPLRLAANPGVVAGEYIVVLKDSGAMRAAGLGGPSSAAVVSAATSRVRRLGVTVRETYSAAFRGYLARMGAAELDAVRRDPAVAYVQENQRYSATTTQDDAPWGLDRIDQRGSKRNGRYYYTDTGAGVTAYVVDTGIYPDHLDFTTTVGGATTASRVSGGVDLVKDGYGTDDCAGHGTHVSGTIGGTRFGVAKDVKLVPVRVLDCAGNSSSATVAKGLDWIVSNHTSGPAVANLSLANQGGADSVVEKAVERVIADGVTTVVAAGNGDDSGKGIDACTVSPSRVRNAITVGASTTADKRAVFSNYGSCVDLYAPGQGIESDWNTTPTEVATLDGTSMATPHVAGAVALYLEKHRTASPKTVQSAIVRAATQDAVTNVTMKYPRDLLFAVQPVTPPPATSTAGTVPTGQALLKGRKICSANTLYCLSQSSADGHLQLTKPGARVLFDSGKAAAWTTMQSNGRLVSLNQYGQTVWSAGSTSGAATLKVLDNGTAVIVSTATGETTWVSNKAQRTPVKQVASRSAKLDHAAALYRAGVKMQSPNKKFQLFYKSTGDLVLWKVGTGRIWHTGVKDGDWLTVASTGNLILYRSDGKAVWTSKTSGRGAARLVVENNGNLSLRKVSSNAIVWQTRTAGK